MVNHEHMLGLFFVILISKDVEIREQLVNFRNGDNSIVRILIIWSRHSHDIGIGTRALLCIDASYEVLRIDSDTIEDSWKISSQRILSLLVRSYSFLKTAEFPNSGLQGDETSRACIDECSGFSSDDD